MRITTIPYHWLIAYSKLHSRKNLYHFLYTAIQDHTRGKKNIISIGSGGKIKSSLMRAGVSFKEVDRDAKRNPDYVCNMENMSIFTDNSIDVYFCMEVLEHVQNPFAAVAELSRTLKPGGVIIGSTPFIMPLHDEPYDFYRYTKYGLHYIFKDFIPLKLVERNSYLESVYVVVLRLLNIGTKKQKIVAIALSPIFILLLPAVLIFSPLITNKQSTTGYFFIFQKRSTL